MLTLERRSEAAVAWGPPVATNVGAWQPQQLYAACSEKQETCELKATRRRLHECNSAAVWREAAPASPGNSALCLVPYHSGAAVCIMA